MPKAKRLAHRPTVAAAVNEVAVSTTSLVGHRLPDKYSTGYFYGDRMKGLGVTF